MTTGTDKPPRTVGEATVNRLDIHGWLRQFVIISCTAIGMILGLVFAWKIRAVHPTLAAIDIGISLFCIVIGVWAVLSPKSGLPRRLLALVVSAFFYFLFVTGGVEGLGIFWGLAVPGTVFFILGFRDGLALSSLYFAAVLVGYFLAPLVPAWKVFPYSADFMTRYLGVYVLIAIVTGSYEYLRMVWAKTVVEEAEGRIRAEAESRAHAERLSAVVEASPIPLIVFEPSGRCLSGSRSVAALSLSGTAVFPAGVRSFLPSDLAADILWRCREVEETGRPSGWKCRSAVAGDERLFEVLLFPLASSGMFGAFVQDRTEEERMKAELEEARRRAEESSQAKSRFLSVMSHEMRTPLSALLAAVETVRSADPAERERASAVIVAAGETLRALIDDILDLARIEAGRMEPVVTDFGLRDLLADLVRIAEVKAVGKPVTVRWEAAGSLPERLVGDPNRLRQILLNLLGNAVKFTPSGEVVLRAEPAAEEDDRVVVRFSVRDTGIGIPADKMGLLFRRFFQVDPEISRRYGGTGLGLAIVKELAELMGGSVAAESRLGEGSVFTVLLPFGRAAEDRTVPAAMPERMEPANRAGAVLLVDDTDYARESMAMVLKSLGYEVETVASGPEALERLRQSRYGLVLLDMRMPGMDGMETFRRIREEGHDVPVVAVTADALPETVEGCRRAGMDDVLTKPFRVAELRERLRRWSG